MMLHTPGSANWRSRPIPPRKTKKPRGVRISCGDEARNRRSRLKPDVRWTINSATWVATPGQLICAYAHDRTMALTGDEVAAIWNTSLSGCLFQPSEQIAFEKVAASTGNEGDQRPPQRLANRDLISDPTGKHFLGCVGAVSGYKITPRPKMGIGRSANPRH